MTRPFVSDAEKAHRVLGTGQRPVSPATQAEGEAAGFGRDLADRAAG